MVCCVQESFFFFFKYVCLCCVCKHVEEIQLMNRLCEREGVTLTGAEAVVPKGKNRILSWVKVV